jgi:hypothetical protein
MDSHVHPPPSGSNRPHAVTPRSFWNSRGLRHNSNDPLKPSPGAAVAAFEKVPLENDLSILWKHVSARRVRFVYHYHPEIELIHFVDGEGVEFVGDSSQTFKAGHLVVSCFRRNWKVVS